MNKSQIKVLEAIYAATDCSNEVFDYAILHPSRRRIAESMPSLVEWFDGCLPVDDDGFVKATYTEGRGYRLTLAGYEALTAHDPEAYPARLRRWHAKPAPGGGGG